MKFCISFGKFELKYFFYCILLVFIYLYMMCFIYFNKVNITYEHMIFNSFLFFLGYLLNIIPTCISLINSKEKEKPITNKLDKENDQSIEYIYNEPYEKYISKKDILKFFFISLILLLSSLLEIIQYIIDNIGYKEDEAINHKDKIKEFDDNRTNNYEDGYIFIEIIIFFVVSKFNKEAYYKHQNISFLFLILVEIIKNIYFLIKKTNYNIFDIIHIVLNIINSIIYI